MKLIAVAAISKNNVLGKDNVLPWSIPEDMKYFRELTKGKILIMGRKTFESLGGPLKGRYHIIISRSETPSKTWLNHPSVEFARSIEEAKEKAEKKIPEFSSDVYVIGGAEIYNLLMPHLDQIHLTVINIEIKDGDAFFPAISKTSFVETQQIPLFPLDTPSMDSEKRTEKDPLSHSRACVHIYNKVVKNPKDLT